MSNTITLQFGGSIDVNLHLAAPPVAEIVTIVSARLDRFTVTARGNHMAYTLPVDKMIVVQVAYVDGQGNPATVETVEWSASNPALCSVAADPGDQTMCTITPTPTGGVGSCQVIADADADLGQGVRSVLTTLDLTLVGGEAVAGMINVVADPQPIAPHPEQQAHA